MNIKSNEKKENSAIELVIEVSAAEFDAAINKVYNKQKKNIMVPGFRKGKVPRKMVEKMYGEQVFFEDAVEEAYPAAYDAALKEAGIVPVAYPKLEIVEVSKDGFTFKALVTVQPEASVKEYKGLVVAKPEVKVTAADVKAEMKPYIDRASRLVSVDRKAKKGDVAVIDFEGFKDGVAFEGGKGENYSLELGSGTFVPGFEEQVIGMKAGEEKDLDITFPEDYHADLAGKQVVFHVKVHEVKEPKAPVVDDEFAKDVSEFETLADFRKDLGEKLTQRREEQAKTAFEDQVLEQLVANMECEIPDGMIETQVDRLMDDFAMRLQSQGISMADYQKMMGANAEMVRASAWPTAQKQVQLELALEAVAKAENLEVTDEELEAEVKRLAEQYGMTAEQVKAAVPEEGLKGDLKLRKARELVLGAAKEGKAKKKAAPKKAAAKKDGEEAPAEKPKRASKKAAESKEEPAE